MHHPTARLRHWLRRSAVALGAATAALTAQAALITFDERPWVFGPDEYAWYSNPVDEEYSALGVHFNTGYLQPSGHGAPFNTQYLLGGPYFSITFSGTLPTFVSLAFSSPIPNLRATVSASTADGASAGSFDTGGFYWAGPELGFVETPYHDNSHATFHSDSGIARLDFDTYASSRIIAKIDNLYFGAVAAVPEPASLAMLTAGLLVLGAAWRRRQILPPS